MRIEAKLARLGYALPEAADAHSGHTGIEIDPRKIIDAL
jgi:hypothetical protein